MVLVSLELKRFTEFLPSMQTPSEFFAVRVALFTAISAVGVFVVVAVLAALPV